MRDRAQESAFPQKNNNEAIKSLGWIDNEIGLTVLEYFAIRAMEAMLIARGNSQEHSASQIAAGAVHHAEELLEALNARENKVGKEHTPD